MSKVSAGQPMAVTVAGRKLTLPDERAGAQAVGRDWSLLLALGTSLLVALAALYLAFANGWILAYNDSMAHLNIARRVLDARTPGLVQLGSVWLPVPHLLMLPFVSVDYLWHTGLAGSIVGLVCFGGTALAIFGVIRLLTRQDLPAWLGLAVFISNPGVLYLQTTALTEPVLLLTMTASCYFLVRWGQQRSNYHLLLAGAFASAAVGTRYDGWFFAGVSLLMVLLASYFSSRSAARAEGTALAYAVLPVYAVFIWLFYNWLVWGDALEFQRGVYSAQYQQEQILHAGQLPTKGDLGLSLSTYSWATVDTVGPIIAWLAVMGAIAYLLSTRLRSSSLTTWVVLSPFVFNVIALFVGQTIISVPQSDSPGYFNVRYGILLLPAAAIFVAFLAHWLTRRVWRPLVATVLLALVLVQVLTYVPTWPMSVLTLADGLVSAAPKAGSLAAAAYLGTNYDGGGVLIDDVDPVVVQRARLDMSNYVSSFSGQQWWDAVAQPSVHVRWLVVDRGNDQDRVNVLFNRQPGLLDAYSLQYSASGWEVYRRTE